MMFNESTSIGSLDGVGAIGDHDEPYKFGVFDKLATLGAKFNSHQLTRLVVLRGLVREDRSAAVATLLPARPACAHPTVKLDASGMGVSCIACGLIVSADG